MFIKRIKHYQQWLRTAIPLKAKLGQISSDSVRLQGPSKRTSSDLLYLLSENTRERVENVKSLKFYSRLFLVSKPHHTSDIRPATLSSWLKQTILLCYKQADLQALDLVQVKAHDIRAFAASKAFSNLI